MKFSKTTNGFYLDNQIAPQDALEITDDLHSALLIGQSGGKQIVGDNNGLPILVDPLLPTIEEVWENIKTQRDKRLSGGINAGGKWFHSDVYSITQHLGLKDGARDILAAGGGMSDPLIANGNPVMWKTLDGSFAALTVQGIFDIVEAGKNMQSAIFTTAEMHKAQMEAIAEPWTYDYSVDWPLSYADSILQS